MLKSFTCSFDYRGLEKKLRHYFSDTAPVLASIELRMGEVKVTCDGSSGSLAIHLDGSISIKENIKRVISDCEKFIYPKMLELSEQAVSFSNERVEELVMQGLSIERIREKEVKKVWRRFVITRFNTGKNSIEYKEEFTGRLFRAYFNRPLIICREKIFKMAANRQEGMRELYRFVVENSRIVEIEVGNAALPENIN
jgi:hypothetical protein